MKDIAKGSSGDVIRVQVKEFKGNEYLDIRTFYTAQDGEKKPTKKGVALPMNIAQEVISAAQALIK